MDDDRIVLDRKSFEALAVDSRVKILKSLKQRRKTLSELADEQRMSVSGVKEHLETLEKVGLVIKKDDGHKWKYYELTKKGGEIIGPKEIRVWILLATSIIALFGSFMMMQAPIEQQIGGGQLMAEAAQGVGEGEELRTAAADQGTAEAESESFNATLDASLLMTTNMELMNNSADEKLQDRTGNSINIPLVVFGISLVAVFGCLAILVKNRIKPASG